MRYVLKHAAASHSALLSPHRVTHMANSHVMQSVSMLVDAPQLQLQLQSRLDADQLPPHEVLLGICLNSCVRFAHAAQTAAVACCTGATLGMQHPEHQAVMSHLHLFLHRLNAGNP